MGVTEHGRRKAETKQLIVRIPADLHERVRQYAARTDRSMAQVARRALRQLLDEETFRRAE